MRGGKHLLLLAAFVLQARCQDLKVSMSPELHEIFSGDLIYLTCDNSASGSEVMWYLNETKVTQGNKTLKIPVANPVNSGMYHCESNGKSEGFKVVVKENLPGATLEIKTGQPVMPPGQSVILELDNDGGLQGWKCWVYRGFETRRIVLKTKDNPKRLAFQTTGLKAQETIYWCTDDTKKHRSNQITLRTSEKHISLEMYPQPAVVGENLILRCYVWGTNQISHVVFYKKGEPDWKVIQGSDSPTYKIHNVTESAKGQYKCNAIYTHVARTDGPPYNVTSDVQEVFVQDSNVKAVVYENIGLSCSCAHCPKEASYHWYYKKTDDQSWTWKYSDTRFIPRESATYACRAMWNNGRSFLSHGHNYQPPIKLFVILLIVLLMLLFLAAAALATIYIRRKKRNTSGPVYEDVALRQRDKGDDKYETLQKTRGAQNEGEYDTLNPEAPGRERKEGEYEALTGTKEVYHTLGMQGAEGGEGSYEALKKEGMKEGVYHTLGVEGAAGGGREYEALKKEGMKEGVYHTLGVEEAAGGAKEYEALKKEGMTEGVYHTLGMEGAAGGSNEG